ncbi:MAG: type II toxin-antitoxin system antitoxin SocA domain-containing protein [Pseudomonadota bacterium]
MAAHHESVARYLAEKAKWDVSNLKLQKLMYIAQVINMGRTNGQPLFDGEFQAWDYGPVLPELYRRLKVFGAGGIADVFSNAKRFQEDDPHRAVMDDVCERFLKYSAGDLVDITHSEKGAWAEHYVPGARNIPIPRASILDEYRRRVAA